MLTDEQKEIVETKSELLTVTAFAGTGKTTSLCHFANARAGKKILYLAFNKAMVIQAQGAFKLSANVEAKTIHSLAFKYEKHNLQSALGELRMFDIKPYCLKCGVIIKTVSGLDFITRLFNEYLLSASPDPKTFISGVSLEVKAELNLYQVSLEQAALIMSKLWEDISAGVLSTPHNFYLKRFQLNKIQLGYDWIMVDEAQDINDCAIDIILNQQSKIILVGDPYQQIYSWNGAVNAIAKVKKKGADSLYLTQSFRCPKTNEGMVNGYLELLGSPKKFKGRADSVEVRKSYPAFLARTNVGLFEAAVNYHKEYSIYYNGGFDRYEFDSLVDLALLKLGKKDTVKNFLIKSFTDYEELKDYTEQSVINPLKPKVTLVEKYDSRVIDLYENLKDRQAFTEFKADIIFSTTHKAKGLEYGIVNLANDFIDLKEKIVIAKYGNQSGPVVVSKEEFHLLYVAITRSLGNVYSSAEYTLTPDLIKIFLKMVDDGEIEYC